MKKRKGNGLKQKNLTFYSLLSDKVSYHCLVETGAATMNKKGFTLLEVLIAVSLMAVLSGVSIVGYNSIKDRVYKRELRKEVILFMSSLKTCINSSGGWSVEKPDGTIVTPCDSLDDIDYQCPSKSNSKDDIACSFVNNGSNGFACFDISKTIGNTQHRLYGVVNIDNTSENNIVCGQLSALSTSDCNFGYAFDSNDANKKTGGSFKEIDCEDYGGENDYASSSSTGSSTTGSSTTGSTTTGGP